MKTLFVLTTMVLLSSSLLAGESKDYPNVAEWKTKDTGYHTGDMVKYKSNIFRAAYWAGKEPGNDPGWSLYDELYDETSHNATPAAKVIGYLPTWRKDLDYGNAVMYQNITHGIIAFLQFDEKNLGELDDKSAKAVTAIVQQVVTTAHKSGTYISVAIGGATDYGFLNLLTAVGSNGSDARLDKAVQNVVKFVKDNALDGVDLDLECWWDPNGNAGNDQGGRAKSKGPHPAGSALVLFAQKLKAAMSDKLLSATLFATSWYGNNYDPKLANHVDWLSIMSYDLTGSWNQTPVGPHTALYKIRKQDQYAAEQQGPWPTTAKGPTKNSTPTEDNPIFSVEDSLWYWSNPFFVNWQGPGQKVARNKLAAGVPLYGYDFAYKKDKDPESGQTPPGYKVLRYKELVQQFPGANTAANANIKVSGNTPRPDFVSASGSYPYAHNIYLETPDTAVAKLNFPKKLGLQGVIIWELSNEVWDDGKSIVKALYKASGNPATRPALPAPKFAAQSGGLASKPPMQSSDLTGKAGQAQNNTDFRTNGTPGIAVYKDVLFAVYEDRDKSTNKPTGRIWYATFKNGKWESPKGANTNSGTTGAPALIVYKDKLYAFHEGFGQNGQLWYMRGAFDNGNFKWENDKNTGFGTTGAPALAIYNDKLYCVHLAKGGKPNQLWWACYDGEKWETSDTLLGNQRAATTPSLAVYNNKLYCAYQGAAKGEFWYVIYGKKSENDKSESWTAGNKTAYATYGAPALAAYNGKLHAFHEGYELSPAVGAVVGAVDGAIPGFAFGGPAGAAAGAVGGAAVGAKAGAAPGRSYKLWYTGCETEKTDFTAPADTDTGFGITDPPSLVVANNKLYCVHAGRGGNGEIWWFSVDGNKKADDGRSGDGKLNGSTASPPALAELQGDLYCVYQKAGTDGYIAWTKLPIQGAPPTPAPIPNSDPVWVEAHGANAYCYYELDENATGQKPVQIHKTIKVDEGAPFLYAGLTRGEEDVDLPPGATLRITAPDGTEFSSERDDDRALVFLAGTTLQQLVIKQPVAGEYKVDMSIPGGTPFHFEFETVPSKDVVTTIVETLGQTSVGDSQGVTKRSLSGPGTGTGGIIRNPVAFLRSMERALGEVARAAIRAARRNARNRANAGNDIIAELIGKFLTPSLAAMISQQAVVSTVRDLLDALQNSVEEEQQPNEDLDGNFLIDLYDGNRALSYPTYRTFIQAVRIAHYTRRAANNDFAVRVDFAGLGGVPWMHVRVRDLYLTQFNSNTIQRPDGGMNAPEFLDTARPWRDIPPNLINYPAANGDPNLHIIVSLASTNGALRDVFAWTNAGGRGQALSHNAVVILAFVISEAARFDFVQYAVEAAFNFQIQGQGDPPGMLRWDFIRILLVNWQTHFQLQVPVNLTDASTFVDNLPPTEDAERHYLQAIITALRNLHYITRAERPEPSGGFGNSGGATDLVLTQARDQIGRRLLRAPACQESCQNDVQPSHKN